jgi:hypothetical protein
MKTGLYSDIPNADYHGGAGISKSGLDLVARSPLHYWSAYLDPDRIPREESPAMFVGTAIHAAVLEPDKFHAGYLPMPRVDRRTKDGKAVHDEYQQRAHEAGQLLIGADDYAACVSIAAQVRQHPAASVLFADGAPEQSAFWTDPETGLLCKARPDWLRPGAVLDVKSTDDASAYAFQRSVTKWRYHVQAAWYLDGIYHATGEQRQAFVFCVFEKTPPYAAAFYYADSDMLELGRREYQRVLRVYAQCVERDIWPGYSSEILPISLPAWVLNAANDNQEK